MSQPERPWETPEDVATRQQAARGERFIMAAITVTLGLFALLVLGLVLMLVA